MNNHFTITVHDDNGVQQYNLHHFVKQAIMYAVLFLGIVALISIGTILYLNDEVDAIEEKRLNEQSSLLALQDKNQKLTKNIAASNKMLNDKKDELAKMTDSLCEIEELIGLTPAQDMPLKERVNIAKLNSEDINTLLQFVPNGSPVVYKGITSKYGYRIHPTLKTKEYHRGSDMKARMNTPVYATADGIVEWSGFHKRSGYGNLIIIQHNYGFKTYYGHLKKVVLKSGTFVKKGDLIAYSGSTGMSNGPHLHYEVRYMTRALNPFWFIKWTAQNYNEIFKKEKKIPWQSLIATTSRIKMVKQTLAQQSSQ